MRQWESETVGECLALLETLSNLLAEEIAAHHYPTLLVLHNTPHHTSHHMPPLTALLTVPWLRQGGCKQQCQGGRSMLHGSLLQHLR